MKAKDAIKILDEQTSTVVGGHVGRAGSGIDNPFAGPFVGDNNLITPLKQQLADRKRKREEMEKINGKEHVGVEHPVGGYHNLATPMAVKTYSILDDIKKDMDKFNFENTPVEDKSWYNIETALEYDELLNDDNDGKYKNDTNKMKNIEKSYIYDIGEKKDMSSFKNKTREWKFVGKLSDLYRRT